MSYFSELRELVGHRPLLMVGATVLIFDNEKHLFLLKRTDNECWGPPGGAVEPGEIVEEAARRETLEETGLEIEGMSLFGVFSGPDQYYRYPSGDEVHNVTIVYLCHTAQGDIHLSDEHTNGRYFALNDIPSLLSPPIVPIIKRLVEEFNAVP